MKVPNKIKHFAWKACKNILSTKENLKKRNITKDCICDSCGKTFESTCHLFWLCDKAKTTWSSSKLVIPFEINPKWMFIDVMRQLQRWTESYPGLVECAIAICWGIWKDRNTVRHGGKHREGKAIVRSSLRVLDEFQAANVQPLVLIRQPPNETKWRPPQPGHYKVNVDGAIFSKKKQVGIGVIIRDSVGMVIATLNRKLTLSFEVLETKAKAMEVGVQFALDIGVRDVTLGGDSLCIYNALQGLGKASSSVHNIVAGMLHLAKGFRNVAFSHTKRQANVPTHLLAQHATNVENYVAWLEECPSHVELACTHDVSSLSINE
ncbi:putative ribonuclease h protein [Quercus suber]|uniref:Ribonuclease h protein n=1 Tax=Quercus suber TaxID=58331 RepID=A0AAW0KQ10_QUESU